jgi:uncharacterized membrane protein/thiol-disulfide isomerase/thioredoxin
MKQKYCLLVWAATLVLLALLLQPLTAVLAQNAAVVHIVYFYSEDFTDCKAVEEEVLRPLSDRFAEQLVIRRAAVGVPSNDELLIRAEERFAVSSEERKLPTLIIGDQILIGEESVRQQLMTLVEEGLAHGGVDWPDLPGLNDVVFPGMTTSSDASAGVCIADSVDNCGAAEPTSAAPLYHTGPTQDVVVRAVYFYSPSCPNCHKVATEVLPSLREQHGAQLQILELDTSQSQGYDLFEAAVAKFNPDLVGVPTLVIGDNILVGSVEIPNRLPDLIRQHLASGGIGWPDLPGIEDAAVVFDQEPSALESLRTRFARDLAGNSLSVVVLIGLVAAFVAVVRSRDWQPRLAKRFAPWGSIVVIAVGLVAAIYLTYVETTHTQAVCGPVGDCNAVQQSEFALLFGFLPVAVWGLMGYVLILAAYVYGTWIKGPLAEVAPAVVFVLSLFGLVFSTYLTFLEPFVIGATCAWCLTSAVCMLLITLLSAGPGWPALKQVLKSIGVTQ